MNSAQVRTHDFLGSRIDEPEDQPLKERPYLLPAPLAALPHGGTVPRASWEELYNVSYAAAHGGGAIVVKQPKAEGPADSPALPKATQVRPQPRSGGRR